LNDLPDYQNQDFYSIQNIEDITKFCREHTGEIGLMFYFGESKPTKKIDKEIDYQKYLLQNTIIGL